MLPLVEISVSHSRSGVRGASSSMTRTGPLRAWMYLQALPRFASIAPVVTLHGTELEALSRVAHRRRQTGRAGVQPDGWE